MKYTLTKRDIGILFGFFGIVILGLVYYFVYIGYKDKTKELAAANEAMQARVDVLQDLVNRQDELVSSTQSNNSKAEEILAKFPAGFEYEDAILFGIDLTDVSPMESMPVIGFSEEEELYAFTDVEAAANEQVRGYIPEGVPGANAEEAAPEEEAFEDGEVPAAAAVLPALKRKITSYTNTTDYSGLKNALAYVLDKDDRCGLNVNATYDATTGMLTDTIMVKSYYVVNTDKVYVEPEMPVVVKGTDDIFGTTSYSRPQSDRLNMGSSGIVQNTNN